MPWVIAQMRGKQVYARATASGQLADEGGRVEIRYKTHDGRMYRAGSRNLKVVDPTPLPDNTCGPAEAPPERGKDAADGKGGAAGKKTAARRSTRKPAVVDIAAVTASARVVAFTDGACSGNPGPAGLGVVYMSPERRVERFEYLGRATNNIAELTAILRAVEELGDEQGPVAIFTDSNYSIGVLQGGWKPKKNQELIAGVKQALSQRKDIKLHYVKGHAGIELNEKADELARRAVDGRASGRDVLPA